MNIIEAIKSGKKFRRPRQTWRDNPPGANTDSPLKAYSDSFDYFEILADDWEIEEKKVEITKEILLRAIERAIQYPGETGRPAPYRLIKELGLE